MNLKKFFSLEAEKINGFLNIFLPDETVYPELLHKALRYSVFSGGKRIRPIMCVASYTMCGGRKDEIYPVACAMELIHAYSLIHDDLPAMDNDDYRRGKLSCHKKFGEATAILTGDALLAESYRLLSCSEDAVTVKKLVEYVSFKIGSRGMCGGQVADMEINFQTGSKNLNQKLSSAEYINTHKTAALMQACLVSGAVTAKADERIIKTVEEYGYFVGLLFQIVDDIIDNDGYVEILGKEKTFQKASELLKQAKQSIKKIGGDGCIFAELADFIFNRIKHNGIKQN